jgi:hypothetical protein
MSSQAAILHAVVVPLRGSVSLDSFKPNGPSSTYMGAYNEHIRSGIEICEGE